LVDEFSKVAEILTVFVIIHLLTLQRRACTTVYGDNTYWS